MEAASPFDYLSAPAAFESGPWRRTTGQEQGRLIWKLAVLLDVTADGQSGSGRASGFAAIEHYTEMKGAVARL